MYLTVAVLASLAIGIVIGILLRKYITEHKIEGAKRDAENILKAAKEEANAKKREIILEARERAHQIKIDTDREVKEKRQEIQRLEKRLLQREETLDRRLAGLERRESILEEKEHHIEKLLRETEEIKEKELKELENIAKMSQEEAKELLLVKIENEVNKEAGALIRKIEENAKREGEIRAKEILATAIQRCAVEHTSEITVSVVSLPNDEMKGRIIGREGRNIRIFEQLTGVDLIVDDTPEAVVLSSFDPVRREVARRALEKLIGDGRIHPARIEELVEKAKAEISKESMLAGEEALTEMGIEGVHEEIIKHLGNLKYRRSYGQNVLQHSIEVAYIAGMLANELGVDVQLAKRAGLLHDIGKSISLNTEGTHALLGAEIAKRYGEKPEIVHAIAAHHGEVEVQSLLDIIIQVSDAVSASRPGARRESLETYIRRLEKLEEVANSFSGVSKAYAIQAGRELRIIVDSDIVDDDSSYKLARDIAKKIEETLSYPGQVKVVVIRETRSIEYAK